VAWYLAGLAAIRTRNRERTKRWRERQREVERMDQAGLRSRVLRRALETRALKK